MSRPHGGARVCKTISTLDRGRPAHFNHLVVLSTFQRHLEEDTMICGAALGCTLTELLLKHDADLVDQMLLP